jgi:hypothetical protein
MRAVSVAVVALVSMGLIVRAEAPPVSPPLSSGCQPCPLPILPSPAPADDSTLPPLPTASPRNANYTIDARLDPERHTIQGSLILEWRNTTGQPQSALPFHLYWNAFRNNKSTSARGEGRRSARVSRGRDTTRGFGYIQITSVREVTGGAEADLTPGLRYIQPDDANADDRTVAEVQTAAPIAPDATTRFKIDWTAQMPYGDVGRSGWVHDYHFVAQWFPKIGVFWKGAWNAHQFHPFSEFFSDYGVYDVRLTVPQGYIVGATGAMKNAVDNPDGTRTFHFHQDDVHDFAWVTSRRMGEVRARFDETGYRPIDIRLLIQPEHGHLAARYIEATKIALRSYGAWSAPYPYDQVTVVDPAWMSASGGMEYPTLFTGGASVFAPPALQSPESVTIHECGHQFWYLLVGTNEFEEAWLDEGFNSYHDEKAAQIALGPEGWGKRYFGTLGGRASRAPIPVVAPGVWLGRGDSEVADLRKSGAFDAMARPTWGYRNSDSYTVNAYTKPALSLQTLENLVGDDVMTRILRTYARRHRFAHPSTEDFIAVVNEVTGQDYRWFFDQTWFSAEECDYSISVRNTPSRALAGYAEGPDGRPMLVPAPRDGDGKGAAGPFESEVIVRRLGGVRLPVDVRVEFGDGRVKYETWDGQYRWTRFRYPGPVKVRAAEVDPYGKIALDIDPGNNSWADNAPVARRAASKWAMRWMFWLQNLLELHTLLG